MKRIFLMLMCFCFALPLLANEEKAKKIFEEANKKYANSQFDEAILLYNSILDNGYFSSELHYNLGNAYYKSDSIPKAILHYEKALRLDPGMQDAEKNLALANLKTIDKIEPLPDFFLSKWWKSILNIFHPNDWAKWAVGFMLITLIGMIIYFFAEIVMLKKMGFYSALLAFILSLTCWLLGEKKHSYLQNSTEAIVMTPTINIYSSPTEGSTKLFVLHKGTKVDMKDRSGNWIKIRIPDGNEGWMKVKDVAEI